MLSRKVLIFGCGVIGGNVIDLLSRMPDRFEITVAARNRERVTKRVNLAIAVAMNLGLRPQISSCDADLSDIERTADLLYTLKPEIIVNATSLQTFWLISTLPNEQYRLLDEARIGPWLPNHLALCYKLMLAIQMANVHARVVNASFPDAVNPALAKIGLAPFIGAGNIANTIPTMRRGIAHLIDCPLEKVDVKFCAHHFVGNRIASYGETSGAPYHLTAYFDGEDITDKLNTAELFQLFTTRFKRLRGIQGQIMASSSVASIVRAIANDSGALLHAPGPAGLPGGYPLRVGADRIEVALPERLSLEEAIQINETGQQFEGIEKIDDDGTVHFSDREMNVMKRILGYSCKTMKIGEVDEHARELGLKYKAFSQQFSSQIAA